jgi:hypothetical protein
MKKNQHRKLKANPTYVPTAAGFTRRTIRMETVQATESLAYEMTLEMLGEQYNEGGYLAFIQAMVGFVKRYDEVLSEAELQGQDEKMCRAIGASDIALTFIPAMRDELEKLTAH